MKTLKKQTYVKRTDGSCNKKIEFDLRCFTERVKEWKAGAVRTSGISGKVKDYQV